MNFREDFSIFVKRKKSLHFDKDCIKLEITLIPLVLNKLYIQYCLSDSFLYSTVIVRVISVSVAVHYYGIIPHTGPVVCDYEMMFCETLSVGNFEVGI